MNKETSAAHASLPPIKGAWIEGGYIVVAPATTDKSAARAVRQAILALAGQTGNHLPDTLGTPCVEWHGYRDRKGYGRKGGILMHRVAYCKYHGIELSEIDGQVIRHKCDNPGCVNPEHLEPGTVADNNHDTVNRGRQAKGEKNGAAKLTAAQVTEIRERYIPGSRTVGSRALAREYGVSDRQIGRIVDGSKWADHTMHSHGEQKC
jgi:hypothetical protein